jgi:DNA-binding transcriptional LysR family regulator
VKSSFSLDTVDLRLLRVFIAVVDNGGFAPAQEPLDLSLSTISNHMLALETRLGTVLCQRGRAGFRLTPDGELAYAEARRLMAAIEGFQSRIGALRTKLRGTLRIGLIDNIITDPRARIDAVVRRFVDAAPQVSLSITTRPPNELLREIASGAIQVAFGSFPRIVLGFDYTDLYDETHFFYCGREHPLFDRPDASIDIETLRRHRIIARAYWGSRDLKPFAIAASPATVNDMEAEAHLILSGAFIGYLPDHYARRFVDAGAMRAIRPNEFVYKAPFQLAHGREALADPVVRLFVGLVKAEIASGSDGATSPAAPAGTTPADPP